LGKTRHRKRRFRRPTSKHSSARALNRFPLFRWLATHPKLSGSGGLGAAATGAGFENKCRVTTCGAVLLRSIYHLDGCYLYLALVVEKARSMRCWNDRSWLRIVLRLVGIVAICANLGGRYSER